MIRTNDANTVRRVKLPRGMQFLLERLSAGPRDASTLSARIKLGNIVILRVEFKKVNISRTAKRQIVFPLIT